MSPPQSPAGAAPSGPLHRFVVPEAEAGRRLDALVAAHLGVGRRAAARLVEHALRNGRPAAKGERVAGGDEIAVPDPDAVPREQPPAMPRIARLTAQVAVLDKPAGLAAVRLAGGGGTSVAAWLARELPECAAVGAPGEAGLVHRLDAGTSGLLLAARSETAYGTLRAAFARRAIEKTYLAVVHGALDAAIEVTVAVGQHPKSRRRMRAIAEDGARAARYRARPAATRVEPLERLGAATLVRATTRSGARHQIRVHLAHAGHPLVADELYGGAPLPGVEVFLLHAESIAWPDPATGEEMRDELPPPPAWEDARRRLVAGAARPPARPAGG